MQTQTQHTAEQQESVAAEAPVPQGRVLDLEWFDTEWFQVWLRFSQKQPHDSN